MVLKTLEMSSFLEEGRIVIYLLLNIQSLVYRKEIRSILVLSNDLIIITGWHGKKPNEFKQKKKSLNITIVQKWDSQDQDTGIVSSWSVLKQENSFAKAVVED